MSESDPLLGVQLGSYHIERRLAEGGLGVVYVGEHLEIHRPVAIKVIRRELVTDPAVGARFVQEARAVANLRHPSLIDIFDIGTMEDGRVYYVMELLSGRTLGEQMKSPLPFADFIAIVDDLLSALEVAHAAGIVHRDLKPDNLFLVERAGEAPLVKVLDFGVAKVLGADEPLQSRLTRTGTILGTPQYMAPEQIEGAPTDHRADIYAVGVILYELATRRLPFSAPTVGGMLKAHLLETPPRFVAEKLAPGVPPTLEPVVTQALQKDPAQRYPTVRALREDLGRVRAGATPLAAAAFAAAEAAARAPAGRSRRRLWIGVGVGVGVGAAALGGVALLALRPRAAPPAPSPVPVAARPRKAGPDVAKLRSRALGTITAGIKDGDPAVRRQALEALARGSDPRHAGLVLPLLDDADLSVRAAAANTLAALGAPEALAPLRRLAGTPPRLELAAADALLRLGDPDIARDLLLVVKKGDEAQRLQAAIALGIRDKEARKLLGKQRRSLGADDPRRGPVVARLAAGDDDARAELAGQLEASPPLVQLMAAESLARLGDERGRQRLAAIAAGGTPLSLVAYRSLATLDDQTGFDVFKRRFADASAPLSERIIAAEGLGASGERSVLEPLGAALDDPEPGLRLAAAGAILGVLSGDAKAMATRSLDWATSALGSSSWLVRAQAASVLADSNPAQALPLLKKAIADERPEVRKMAARSLGRTHAAAAVPLLDHALEDATGEVRMTALRSLGHIADKSTAPVLQRHLLRATAGERVVAAGQLLRLGDSSHVSELSAGLHSADPAVRKLAVEESASAPSLAGAAAQDGLRDRDPGVRVAAALQLAERKDEPAMKLALPVLQDAVKRGGAESIAAVGALQKLGIKVESQLKLDTVFTLPEVDLRLDAVAATANLGANDALHLYRRALEDVDPRVRMAALEGIADHRTLDDGRRLALLRRLANDGDAAVRAKAGAVWARLAPPPPPSEGETAPVMVAPDLALPPPLPDLAVGPDLGGARDGGAVADAGAAVGAIDPAKAAAAAAREQESREEAHQAMMQGELALKAGRLDAAVRELQRARKLNPKLPVHFSLAEAYRKQGDRERDRGRQRDAYTKAIELYKKSTDKRAAAYADELSELLKN